VTLKEFAKQAMCGKKHKKKKPKLAGAFIRTKVAQIVTSASRYKPPSSNIRHITGKSKMKIPGVRIVGSKSKKLS
jgi:hypothetical protein